MSDPQKTYNAKTDGGATGDGATPDSAALNALLARMKDGYAIYFPAGIYVLDKPLLIEGMQLHIYGDGVALETVGTRLKRSVDAPAIIYTAKDSKRVFGNILSDLAIDGASSFKTDAIQASEQGCMRFDNVFIGRSGGNGLYLKNVWDSVFIQVFIWISGDGSGKKAALYIEGAEKKVANNDHRYVGCHFEHCESGPLLIVAGPTVGDAEVFTNSIVFENCKFETSRRKPGDASPLQLSALHNSAFIGCRFSLYGREPQSTADRIYCLSLEDCAGIEVVAGLCVNKQETPPTGFALVKSSQMCRFSLRGFLCGDLDIVGKSRGIVRDIADYATTQTGDVGRCLLDFSPGQSVDAQVIARTAYDIVEDPRAPRGRALRVKKVQNTSTSERLHLPVGGGGVMGITVYATVRMDAGSSNYFFYANRGGASFPLKRFSADAEYKTQYCILPRDFVTNETKVMLYSSNTTGDLFVADVGWLQGMFEDFSPETNTATNGLKTAITFETGEVVRIRSVWPANKTEGWAVTRAGTTIFNHSSATPDSGVKGDITAASNVLRITSGQPNIIMVGTYVSVRNVPAPARVLAVTQTELTLDKNASANASNAAVDFFPPTFKAEGAVASMRVFKVLNFAAFVLAIGLLIERFWKAFGR